MAPEFKRSGMEGPLPGVLVALHSAGAHRDRPRHATGVAATIACIALAAALHGRVRRAGDRLPQLPVPPGSPPRPLAPTLAHPRPRLPQLSPTAVSVAVRQRCDAAVKIQLSCTAVSVAVRQRCGAAVKIQLSCAAVLVAVRQRCGAAVKIQLSCTAVSVAVRQRCGAAVKIQLSCAAVLVAVRQRCGAAVKIQLSRTAVSVAVRQRCGAAVKIQLSRAAVSVAVRQRCDAAAWFQRVPGPRLAYSQRRLRFTSFRSRPGSIDAVNGRAVVAAGAHGAAVSKPAPM
jgi:hypothetical protein